MGTPAQVRRPVTNREVETLDERGVQGRGILRLPQRCLQPSRCTDLHAALDPDDTIVPQSLEHLTIDALGTKEASDHADVVLEAVGGDPRNSNKAAPADDVADYRLRVSIRAAAEDAPGPQPGTHLDGRNSHTVLRVRPMNVQRASAGSSRISKPRNSRWLKRVAAVEARSSHRAMVLRERGGRHRVWRRGVTSPVSRRRCFRRRTHEVLTWYLSATTSAFIPRISSVQKLSLDWRLGLRVLSPVDPALS